MLSRHVTEMEGMAMNGEELFYAQQNAKIVKDAEEYYRSMFTKNTWNMRDNHMVNTLSDLLDFFKSHYSIENPKAVVWAHNSHVGDASAEEDTSKTNIGELSRERFGLSNTYNIGFTTYEGTVTAADDWDAPPKRKRVRSALSGSYEDLLHRTNIPFFSLIFRSNTKVKPNKQLINLLDSQKLERAIGVVYRPDTERASHYFFTSLPNQFDCVIHIDKTKAVQPLDKESYIDETEPETYPFSV